MSLVCQGWMKIQRGETGPGILRMEEGIGLGR
jgi:hypothetical protein